MQALINSLFPSLRGTKHRTNLVIAPPIWRLPRRRRNDEAIRDPLVHGQPWGFLLVLILALTLLLSGCDTPQSVHSIRIFAFGTLIDVTLAQADQQQVQQAELHLTRDFQTMHHEWHAWEPGTLNRINLDIKQGKPASIKPELLPMLTRAQTLAIQSEHLFNPAIGQLIALWGFHRDIPGAPTLPPPGDIDALLAAAPNMSNLTIRGDRLHSSNPAVQLDFGGFAKGYGIDLAIETLRSLGIDNAIINAGGDLRAIGQRDTRPWRIGIRNPHQVGVLASATINHDESVFTSGNYERNYKKDNKVYHHIIDPRTGYPATGTASVTIIHSDAATADAAATALFIAGPTEWHRIAKRMGIQYVLLVDEQGVIHMNPSMAARITFTDDNDKNVRLSAPLVEADSRLPPGDIMQP